MVDRLKSIFGNWRLLIPILFLAVGVVIGAKYGVEYWIYTMTHVYTDDARVKGTMVSLSPEVSGLVRKVHIDEGNEVKKGMILIEIDQADYLTQLAQAEAAYELCRRSYWKHNATLICKFYARAASSHVPRRSLMKKSKLSEAETDLAMERDKSKNGILEAEASCKAALSRLKRWSTASRRRKATSTAPEDYLPKALSPQRDAIRRRWPLIRRPHGMCPHAKAWNKPRRAMPALLLRRRWLSCSHAA
jgi:multidrug resistance efflux pump